MGGNDVLEQVVLPEPHPGPGHISIDVADAGVNYAEAMFRRGALGGEPPFVPGMDVSGTVRAVGPDVTGLSVGQRVAAMAVVGGCAEVALAPAAAVLLLPESMDLLTAAALAMAGQTVLGLLEEAARLRVGDHLLVHAAAGGIGTLLAQAARELGGGRLIGTVGDPAKIPYAERSGYDLV